MRRRARLLLPLAVVAALAFGSVAAAQDADEPVTTAPAAAAPADTDGNNEGTPVPPEQALASLEVGAQATGVVALFFDPAYVETGAGGEAFNVQQTLLAQGFTVNTFVGTSTAEWTAALAGVGVVLVPELEVSDLLGSDLEPGALAALQQFLAGGKRLISFSGVNFEFLEIVLGLAPDTLGANESCPCSITAAAAGTEFASGPASIGSLSATATVDVTTLPAGSLNIYADDEDADEAGVARTPVACGSVVYLGWDWFFGEDPGGEDWFAVLEAAVAGATSSCAAPVVVEPTFTG